MKVTIIDFTYCDVAGQFYYATHYYVDGKRVNQNRYYRLDSWIHQNYKWDYSKQRTDKNKNGVRRDYTEIFYIPKEKTT